MGDERAKSGEKLSRAHERRHEAAQRTGPDEAQTHGAFRSPSKSKSRGPGSLLNPVDGRLSEGIGTATIDI